MSKTMIIKLNFILIVLLFLFQNLKAQDKDVLADISTLYVEKLIATAKDNYPRLKAFGTQVNAAKSDLAGAKASWLDPFSFQYVFRSNDANTNAVDIKTSDILNGYQFGVSINPGSLLAKPSQVKKAKEQVRLAQYNLDEYNLQLEAEVKKRYFMYLQCQKIITPVNNAFLEAENNYNIFKIKYQKAETTLEQYNNASTSYNQAYQAKIQAEINFVTAKAALEELTVKKLEEIK